MLQVSICVGSSCHLKGSYQIIKIFEELIQAYKLEDKVELKASFCLGQCTKGVSVKVGETLLESITTSNAGDMFEKHILKKVIL
jgi:NADH:ubiquinone oxidoreductase 24 kD subunit